MKDLQADAFLTAKNIAGNSFDKFDEEVSAQQIAIVKKCVTQVARNYEI